MTEEMMEQIRNTKREWHEIQRKYRISPRHIKMAEKIGLKPHQFKQLDKQKRHQWKDSLYERIEKLYNELIQNKQSPIEK